VNLSTVAILVRNALSDSTTNTFSLFDWSMSNQMSDVLRRAQDSSIRFEKTFPRLVSQQLSKYGEPGILFNGDVEIVEGLWRFVRVIWNTDGQ
jgi:hypothetical protein